MYTSLLVSLSLCRLSVLYIYLFIYPAVRLSVPPGTSRERCGEDGSGNTGTEPAPEQVEVAAAPSSSRHANAPNNSKALTY